MFSNYVCRWCNATLYCIFENFNSMFVLTNFTKIFFWKKKLNYLKCFILIWLISLEKHVFVDNYNKRPTHILIINALFNVEVCKNNISIHFFLKINPIMHLSIFVFSTAIVLILYKFKYTIICINTLFNNNYIQVQNIV